MQNKETCPNCGGEKRGHHKYNNKQECDASYAYVVHDYYGCESGCCGHNAYLCDKNGNILASEWEFSHPYSEDDKPFIDNLIRKYWKNITIDYDKCQILND